jgi:hypothetical protein
MCFRKYPYKKIERVDQKWVYELDISILYEKLAESKE